MILMTIMYHTANMDLRWTEFCFYWYCNFYRMPITTQEYIIRSLEYNVFSPLWRIAEHYRKISSSLLGIKYLEI